MGLMGLMNVRAMNLAASGKSGDEIRADAKRNFGLFGNNMFTESWAKQADRNLPRRDHSSSREDAASGINGSSLDRERDYGGW